jgi:hypothetical protein
MSLVERFPRRINRQGYTLLASLGGAALVMLAIARVGSLLGDGSEERDRISFNGSQFCPKPGRFPVYTLTRGGALEPAAGLTVKTSFNERETSEDYYLGELTESLPGSQVYDLVNESVGPEHTRFTIEVFSGNTINLSEEEARSRRIFVDVIRPCP